MLHRLEEAAGSFRQALALQPDLAEACSNLGETLRQLNQYDEAVQWCRRAIALRPGFAKAHVHLGAALLSLGALDEAVAALHEALRVAPNLVEARTNLAHALWRLGRLEEAAGRCEEALAIKPDFAEAHNLLGVVRGKQHRLAESLAHFDRALQLDPNSPKAHLHRGLVLLLQGNLPEGFREYESRTQAPELGVRPVPTPVWDGTSFTGRTLLLHFEQGLGDTIQFLRFAPLVKQRGGTVLFTAPRPFLPLVEGCPGIDGLVPAGTVPSGIDLHTSLLSLPHLLGTTLDTIPARVPYLFPPEKDVRRWRDQLSGVTGFKVGLVWQGNPRQAEDRLRSIPLPLFEPLARVPGVRLISLQVGTGSEQVAAAAGRFDILDLRSRLDQTPGALLDAAALLRNLDLLISCDTALVHLAGALGVPVWMAVPYSPDWRWLLDREDSPWYPTLRLFRAPRPAEWVPVLQRMTEALRAKGPALKP
jgi:Flp pilus assembly protein TadD